MTIQAPEQTDNDRIAADFMAALKAAASPDAVDEIFARIATLDPAVTSAAITAFEQHIIDEMKHDISDWRDVLDNMALPIVRQNFDSDAFVDKIQIQFQAILQIANTKPGPLTPFTQAVLDEVIKLNDDEYCQGPKLIGALVNAYYAAYPEEAPKAAASAAKRQNPLRHPAPRR